MLRTPVAPVLLSLVAAAALSGCAKRNATDSSIGAPEPMSGDTVAGPGGGTPEKPVGLVWIAAAWPGGETAVELRLLGSRDDIRLRAVWRLIGLGWKSLG